MGDEKEEEGVTKNKMSEGAPSFHSTVFEYRTNFPSLLSMPPLLPLFPSWKSSEDSSVTTKTQ